MKTFLLIFIKNAVMLCKAVGVALIPYMDLTLHLWKCFLNVILANASHKDYEFLLIL